MSASNRTQSFEANPVEAPQNQLEQWRAENREAINAYNEHLDTNGASSDGVRSF